MSICSNNMKITGGSVPNPEYYKVYEEVKIRKSQQQVANAMQIAGIDLGS